MIIPSNRKRLTKILFFPVEYEIYTDITSDSNVAYVRICDRSAIELLKSTIETLAIYVASVLIYAIFPIYELIKYRETSLLIPVLFPFSDLVSVNGSIINIANQLFTASIGISGSLGIEVIVCLLKNHLLVMANSICHSIDQSVKDLEKSTRFSNKIVEAHLRNIIIQLQDLDR